MTNSGVGQRGETTASTETVAHHVCRGIDNPHHRSCTPDRNGNAATVIYIISRQTQYIVIGPRAAGWDTHAGEMFNNNGEWLSPRGGHDWSETWHDTIGPSGQRREDAPHNWERLLTAPFATQTKHELPAQLQDSDAEDKARNATNHTNESESPKLPDIATGKAEVAPQNKRIKKHHAKVTRKRAKARLRRRQRRRAETAQWNEIALLGGEYQPNLHQCASSDLRTVQQRHILDKLCNENIESQALVLGEEAHKNSLWVAASERLTNFLEQFWDDNPCTGNDQDEFERFDFEIRSTSEWNEAKHHLVEWLRCDDNNKDRAGRIAENILADLFFDIFHQSQPDDAG